MRTKSLLQFLLPILLAAPAAAQQPGSVNGEIGRSIGGLDGSVHAEPAQTRQALAGGASTWSAKALRGSPSARYVGTPGEGSGSWSPARRGGQTAVSRLSGAAAGAPKIASPGNQPGEARPQTAAKEKGLKAAVPPLASGGPPPREAAFAFTGRTSYPARIGHAGRSTSRQRLAARLKGRGSTGLGKKTSVVKERPGWTMSGAKTTAKVRPN